MIKGLLLSGLLYIGIGGGLVIASVISIYLIKKSKSTKDDQILKKIDSLLPHIDKAIDYAIEKVPEGKTLNALKLTDNAVNIFHSVYEETEKMPMDSNLKDWANLMIKKLAEQRAASNKVEAKNLKK